MATTTLGNGNITTAVTGSTTAGNGTDNIMLNGNGDALTVGNGNDTLSVTGNNDAIQAGNGSDTTTVTGNNDTVQAGNGNDTTRVTGNNDTVTDGNGNDTISITGNADIVIAGNGNDTASITGNNDSVTLGNGNNTVTIVGGNTGTDTVNTGNGTNMFIENINANYGSHEVIVSGKGVDTMALYGTAHQLSLLSGAISAFNSANHTQTFHFGNYAGGLLNLDLTGVDKIQWNTVANSAPVAVNDTPPSYTETSTPPTGVVISGNVLTNDHADAGDVLTVTSVGSVVGTYGTVTFNSDGTYGYTLNNTTALQLAQGQMVQEVPFTYSMSDGQGGTSSAALDISITGFLYPHFSASALPAFGNVQDGTTVTQTEVITLNGDTIPITGLSFSGANASDFHITGAVVNGNGTESVSIAFDPSIIGQENAALNISDGNPANNQSVALSGFGFQPFSAILNPLNFGNVKVGTTGVTYINSGADEIISFNGDAVTLSITGANAADFHLGYMSINGSSFTPLGDINSFSSQSLAHPNDTVGFVLDFDPSMLGPENAVLNISDGNPANNHSVALSGYGVTPLEITPLSVSYMENEGAFSGSPNAFAGITDPNHDGGPISLVSFDTASTVISLIPSAYDIAHSSAYNDLLQFLFHLSVGQQGNVINVTDSAGTATITIGADGTETISDPNDIFAYLNAGESIGLTLPYVVQDALGVAGNASQTIIFNGTNQALVAPQESFSLGELLTVGPSGAIGGVSSVIGNALEGVTDPNHDAGPITFTSLFPLSSVVSAFGATYVISNVTSNSFNINGILGSATITVAANGTEIINDSNGIFQALTGGQSVSFTFNEAVQDALGATAHSSQTITINGSNHAPTAGADSFNITEGSGQLYSESYTTGNILANTTAPLGNATLSVQALDGIALTGSSLHGTFATEALADHNSLTVYADGTFNYVINTPINGSDVFNFTASSGLQTSNSASITFNVTDTAPVTNPDHYSLTEVAGTSTYLSSSGAFTDLTNTPPTHGSVPNLLNNDLSGGGTELQVVPAGTLTDANGSGDTLQVNSDGSFTLTEGSSLVSHTDLFTYADTDGVLQSAASPGNIEIDVTEPLYAANAYDFATTIVGGFQLINDPTSLLLSFAPPMNESSLSNISFTSMSNTSGPAVAPIADAWTGDTGDAANNGFWGTVQLTSATHNTSFTFNTPSSVSFDTAFMDGWLNIAGSNNSSVIGVAGFDYTIMDSGTNESASAHGSIDIGFNHAGVGTANRATEVTGSGGMISLGANAYVLETTSSALNGIVTISQAGDVVAYDLSQLTAPTGTTAVMQVTGNNVDLAFKIPTGDTLSHPPGLPVGSLGIVDITLNPGLGSQFTLLNASHQAIWNLNVTSIDNLSHHMNTLVVV